MKNKLTAVYFSPTAGTKKTVEIMVSFFTDYEAQMIDNTLPRQRERRLNFTAEELIIVACPVYAGQMPPIKDLWRNLYGDGTPCVIAACYGNRHYDDALAQMQRVLTEQGFNVIGAVVPVIPHIFAPLLGANRPDAEDEKVLEDFAKRVQSKLAIGEKAALELPGNAKPEPKAPIPVQKSFDEERCVMCGVCTELCPAGAINGATMETDGAACVSCMRCVKYCRTNARGFNGEAIRRRLEESFSVPRQIEFFV